MKSISTFALTLGLATAMLAGAPADAQRRGKEAAPAVDPNARVYKFSKAARPAIAALQTAVAAKDAAAYATSLAAAQAVATTSDDKYAVAQLQLQNSLNTGDVAQQTAALEALIASGGATPTELPRIYGNLGDLAVKSNDNNRASAAYERLLALQPDDVVDVLAEHRDAREARAQEQAHRGPAGAVVVDRDHVGARHHDLARERVAELEDGVDHLPLVVLDDRGVAGDVEQVAQLGLALERSVAVALAGGHRRAQRDEHAGQGAEHLAQGDGDRSRPERDGVVVLAPERPR